MNWFIRSILLFLLLAPNVASAVGDYKKDDGPYGVVEVQQLALKDIKRDKYLQVTLRAPKTADKKAFPLIVFSHGAGGDSGAFSDLCRRWASYGYVVVNPTHSDSVKQRKAAGETFNPLDPNLKKDIVGKMPGDCSRSSHFALDPNLKKDIVGKVNLLDRHADVRLILDSKSQIDAAIMKAGSKAVIDLEHVGMAGHSAGAMTTQTLAGAKMYTPRGRSFTFTEPRIDAFILISGQGLGKQSFQKDSWGEIKSPMLVIAGSEDYSPVDDTKPETRRHPYEYAKPGDKYLVFIDGATHGSYQGKSLTRLLSETTPENIDYITDVTAFSTTAFLDSYLKSDKKARAYLTSGEIKKYPGGKLDFADK